MPDVDEGDTSSQEDDYPPDDSRTADMAIGLPSDACLDAEYRESHSELIRLEQILRKGEAIEALDKVRTTVRMLGALYHEKEVHTRGQDQNTRANSLIRDLECRRDLHIQMYNGARTALHTLKRDGREPASNDLPHLTVKDTYRRAPEGRRVIGDSRRIDGGLWTGSEQKPMMKATPSGIPKTAGTTEMSKRQSREYPDQLVCLVLTQVMLLARKARQVSDAMPGGTQSVQATTLEEGWIWGSVATVVMGQTENELEKWEREGEFAQPEPLVRH